MQVTETTQGQGLKREFTIVIPATDIESKVSTRLTELTATVQLPGFRPGKVPLALVRKRYGDGVMGEVLQEAVNETTQKVISERGLRLVLAPKVDLKSFEPGKDLEYGLAVEIMPEIPSVDLASLAFNRLKVEVDATELETGLSRLAEQNRSFEKPEKARAAAKGDVVVTDFVGKIDGTAFEGGSANDARIEIGAGTLIPGFEDQLIGTKEGESRVVSVTFPAEYGNAALAGKAATFDVAVKEVLVPKVPPVDDELAKKLGFEALDKLKDAVKEQIGREYDGASRAKLKREMLDKLSDLVEFPLPDGLVTSEFEQIWKSIDEARKAGRLDPDDAGKDEETLKADYRHIAERRVRLGLLLGEIGRLNNIVVNDDELKRAMYAEARRFPGQERQVLEYFQKNPDASNGLRGPIFEDKVVDFVIEMAKVSDEVVSPEAFRKKVAEAEGEAVTEKPAKAKAKAKRSAKAEKSEGEGDAEAKPKAKASRAKAKPKAKDETAE